MTSPDPPATAPWRPTRAVVPELVNLDQHFDADALYSLRAALTAHASDLGAGPVLVEQLLIMASELATNAIRHGGGAGRLRMWRDHGQLHLQISDHGPGLADPTVGTRPPDQSAIGGRGMWICRQLCDDLFIDTGAGGTTITAVVRLDEPGGDDDGGESAFPTGQPVA
ncbi:ATP-binding protein [Micromonospora sp. NPDC003197]